MAKVKDDTKQETAEKADKEVAKKDTTQAQEASGVGEIIKAETDVAASDAIAEKAAKDVESKGSETPAIDADAVSEVLTPDAANEVGDGEILKDVADDVSNEESIVTQVEGAGSGLSKDDVIKIIVDTFGEYFAKHMEVFDLDGKINDFIQRHRKIKEQKLEPDIKLESLPTDPRRSTGIQVLPEIDQ